MSVYPFSEKLAKGILQPYADNMKSIITFYRIPALIFLSLGIWASSVSGQEFGRGFIPDDPAMVALVPKVPVYRNVLPLFIDLREWLPPVGNQGAQGSCTAWATAYGAMSFMFRYAVSQQSGPQSTVPDIRFSPSYVYNQIHRGNCASTSFISVLNTINFNGAPELSQFPYESSDCARQPVLEQIEQSKSQRLLTYRNIDTTKDGIDRIRGELAKRRPVLFAMNTGGSTSSFVNYKAGIFTEVLEETGGHAMLLVGYDDRTESFMVLNSWGTNWGENGYMQISYPALFANLLGNQMYVINELDPNGLAKMMSTYAPKPEPIPAPTPAPLPKPVPLNPEPKPVPPPQPVVIPEPNPVPRPKPVPPPQPVVIPEPKPSPQPRPVLIPIPEPIWTTQRLGTAIINVPAAKECGKLEAITLDNKVSLQGFVPSLNSLREAIYGLHIPAQINIDIKAVRELPWPQCEVLLEYGVASSTNRVEWALQVDGAPFKNSIPLDTYLQIRVKTTSEEAYLYVFYIQAMRDGNVTPLYQPLVDRSGKVLPTKFRNILNLNELIPGISKKFAVTAPFGPEAIVMVATRKPVFNEFVAPGDWNERYLLTRLRIRLAQMSRNNEVIGTDAVLLTTSDK